MMLESLREKIKNAGLDAYVVSYANRFLGQDVLPSEHKLAAICGFTGSAGAFALSKDIIIITIGLSIGPDSD